MAGEFGQNFSLLRIYRCSRQVESKVSIVTVYTDHQADRICGGGSLHPCPGIFENYIQLILRNTLLTNESSAYSWDSRYHDYLDGDVGNSTCRSLQR